MQSGSGGLVYAIAGVCGLRVILFAALSRFCRITAIASRACVLASPKYRARCRPNRRFIVPKHCSTRNRRFEIRLLKRFSEARSGRLRTAFLMIPSRWRPRPFNHRAEPRAFGAIGRRGVDAVDKACFVGAGEGFAAQRAF